MDKIVENVTIYFKSGQRECYKAVSVRKKGVCIGTIVNNFNNGIKFVEQEFIPLYQIQKITVCNKFGKIKDINL